MADDSNEITHGKTVRFRYTLTVDGQVVDSNVHDEPLTYVQGDGQMIPGLEKQLEGMKAGEKKTFFLSEDEAYGPVDPDAVLEVPIEKLPEGAAQPGAMLSVVNDEGENLRAIVKEIQGDMAILDFNHPLAGKTLHFAVEIMMVV